MYVKLVVAKGKPKCREIPLPPTIFVIGRGPQCHLRPHCSRVSKLHCAIARWAGKVVVRDLKSSNGTFINDRRINGEVKVADGDTLRVGSLRFTFRIKTETDPPMQVQVVRVSDVKWLLETQSDPFTLSPNETLVKELADQPLDAAHTAPENGCDPVSAGQYLLDYLHVPHR